MRYEIGKVISIKDLNKPIASQVITESVYDGVEVYSLAEGTDIPVQTKTNDFCYFLLSGKIDVYLRDRLSVIVSKEMNEGQGMIVPFGEASGCKALEDSVAIEIKMGKKIEAGSVQVMEPFYPHEKISYEIGTIVETTIMRSGFVLFEAVALDIHTKQEHQKAIGELILTCLDGEGYVEYLGEKSLLQFGENFRIKNDTEYSLFAQDQRFKVSKLTRIE